MSLITLKQSPLWVPGLGLFVSVLMSVVMAAAPPPVFQAQTEIPPLALLFSPPLGYRDGVKYGPHLMDADLDHDGYLELIEATTYGVKNPDLQGETCFGVDFGELYHAGEDWYRVDGISAAGAEVTAMADGQVVFINNPGRVVILEHRLPAEQKVYSVYTHLDETRLKVWEGEIVSRGQGLGVIRAQPYQGRHPEFHSRDDSHLHFEIRYFYDAEEIYTHAPKCNSLVGGRGYTYPQPPDDFPAPDAGYLNPSVFIREHGGTIPEPILQHMLSTTTERREYFVALENYHELPPQAYTPNLIRPREIILHWDGNNEAQALWVTAITFETLRYLGQSSHFAVDYKRVWQMLPMYQTVVQESSGALGYNNVSINIEMAGTNFDQPGNFPPESQIQLTLRLTSQLMDFYHIPYAHVVGHFERDPRGEKDDPGIGFMAIFRERLAAYRASLSPVKRQFLSGL
jgi:murein DD-endopeptidase MepM/ murein hydrolase activator NlpD